MTLGGRFESENCDWPTSVLFCVPMLLTLALLMGIHRSVRAEELSAIIREVKIEGVRRFDQDEVKSWLVTRRGGRYIDSQVGNDAQRILRAYEAEGFWHTNVHIQKPGDEGRVVFRVQEGRSTTIASFEVTGEIGALQGAIDVLVTVASGAPLQASILDGNLVGLLDAFERVGHPYAQIEPTIDVDVNQPVAHVRVHVDAGPRVTIDGIRFTGLRGARRDVLERESGLRVGDVYDQRRVDRSTRSLRALPYLESVEEPSLEQDIRTGRYWLHYDVREVPSTRLEGAVGLLPGTQGGSRFTGMVNADALNLMGTGRRLHLFWKRPDAVSSDLQFSYREPYLGGMPFAGSVAVGMVERVGYSSARAEVTGDYNPAVDLRLFASAGLARLRPDSLELGTVDRRTAWVTSAGLELNRMEGVWNPHRGYRGRLQVGLERWSASPGNTTDRWKAEADAASLVPTGPRSVGMISFHGRWVHETGRVTSDGWWRLGGSETVRGYVEEQFLAAAATWARLEWRRLLGPRALAFVFADGGLFRMPSNTWEWPVGYGGGLQSAVRGGDLRIEYALGREDGPAEGKIHLRLISTF